MYDYEQTSRERGSELFIDFARPDSKLDDSARFTVFLIINRISIVRYGMFLVVPDPKIRKKQHISSHRHGTNLVQFRVG